MYLQLINNAIIINFDDIIADKNLNIHKLVVNTFNTWQKGRTTYQKESDTNIGKIAEFAVATAFRIFNIPIYYPYDSFRKDNFKLHAPFDALLCECLEDDLVELINSSVKKNGPKLSPEVRKQIRKFNAFTVEIKSTRLAKKYKERAHFTDYNNPKEVENLFSELDSLDFLTYPFFLREGDLNFENYCKFVKDKIGLSSIDNDLKKDVLKIEKENSDDVYIRVFIDEDARKAIIMGWVDKKTFYENASLMKLIQKGKSEKALYFVCPLRMGRPLADINSLLIYYLNEAREGEK